MFSEFEALDAVSQNELKYAIFCFFYPGYLSMNYLESYFKRIFISHFEMSIAIKNNFYFSLLGIGQPLSMLLKLNPAITKLNLYDIVHTPGVAADLSHCETK